MGNYYLGIDYGSSHTGLAVGQDVTSTVAPLDAVRTKNSKLAPEVWAKLFADYEFKAIVMGLPRNMDGSETKFATTVRKTAKWLNKTYAIPVYLVDERNSTTSAKEWIFANREYKGLTKSKIDSISACIILQAFLDGEEYEEISQNLK